MASNLYNVIYNMLRDIRVQVQGQAETTDVHEMV